MISHFEFLERVRFHDTDDSRFRGDEKQCVCVCIYCMVALRGELIIDISYTILYCLHYKLAGLNMVLKLIPTLRIVHRNLSALDVSNICRFYRVFSVLNSRTFDAFHQVIDDVTHLLSCIR